MLDSHQVLKHIPGSTTEELKQIMTAIQSELSKRDKDLLAKRDKDLLAKRDKDLLSKHDKDLSGLVEQLPNFCNDPILIDTVWAECESLNLSNSRSKTSSQWLSPSSDPYIYPDTNPIHSAIDISNYPGITTIMGMVNADPNVDGPLDACLILKYNSNVATLSLHADDEEIIDQTKSICPYSLGSSRTLEFFTNTSKPKAVKEVRMDNNSLTIMKPGAQEKLKHCVRTEPKVTHADVRYSLSFRALSKSTTDQHTRASVSDPNSRSSNVEAGDNLPVPPKRVCLIAGDSYTARLDPVRLGRGVVKVDNVAVGGARIDNVCKQLEAYAELNPNTYVEKLLISVGTNDIRKCYNGVEHLKGPFKNLCVLIKKLYPNAKVFFQTLLPLPLKFEQDWKTNHTIWEFSRIIFNECVYRKFYILDAFPIFTAERQWGKPYIMRNEPLFEAKGIHPNVNVGMGVLARLYLRALHSKYFNPYSYQ